MGPHIRAAAIALALLFVACDKRGGSKGSDEPGSLEEVLRHDAPDGAVLVAATYHYSWRYRLTSLDLATGKELARRQLDDRPQCVSATPGRIWCIIAREPALLDARTLKTVIDLKTLAKQEPLLASGVVMSSNPPLTRDRAVVIVTGDGQHVRIDATTLAASRMGPSDEVPGYWSDNLTTTSSSVTFGAVTFGFRGRDHDELQLLLDQQAPPEAASAAAELAVPAFLSPSLVVDQTIRSPAIQREPPAVLVEHSTSLIAERARTQLTLLELGGRSRWTIEPGGDVRLAATIAGGIVVVLDARPRDQAVALDLATGAVRWRYDY